MEKLQELIECSNGIVFEMNNFFSPHDNIIIRIDCDDLVWVMPIFQKYSYEGLKACFAYIREQMPIPQHNTLNFKQAYSEIEIMNPNVCS